MKGMVAVLIALGLLCSALAGCAPKDAQLGQQSAGGKADSKPDVDLTSLSSTMVYAEVYNMMNEPNRYMGKTVKVRGQYYANYFEDAKQYYHFIVVADATACCQQGLEFIWSGEHTYPDDYPEDGTLIEVTGVYGSYKELGETYYYLAVDDITRRD